MNNASAWVSNYMRPEVLLLDCGGTLSWPPFDRVRALVRELRGVEIGETKVDEMIRRDATNAELLASLE